VSVAPAKFMLLPVEDVDPGQNVRVDDEGLNALVESIKKHGILQPITVVPSEDGKRAECLFGHRRLAAAKAAGESEIPCLARPRGSEIARVLTQVAENRDRKNMTILEEALSYDQLRKAGLTQKAIADSVGTDQSSVSKRLLLLGYPDVVQRAVHWRTLGLTDALGIPLELAQSTDGRTLAAILRRGPNAVRKWIREALGEAEKNGKEIKARKGFGTLNCSADLLDQCRAAARGQNRSIVEWVDRALRAALAKQGDAA
jgi:ParB/RepB/Spo0J family partition protein